MIDASVLEAWLNDRIAEADRLRHGISTEDDRRGYSLGVAFRGALGKVRQMVEENKGQPGLTGAVVGE